MRSYRVLVVDDEESMGLFIAGVVKNEGYQVVRAKDGQEAISLLAKGSYDLVISDLKMPKVDGLTLVSYIKENHSETLVIILTAYGTIDTAVEAVKKGAWDFITKPLASPDQLRLLIKKAKTQQKLSRENMLMKAETKKLFSSEMVVNDPRMEEVIEMVRKVGPTDATVLLTGESGTGKEVIARRVHQESLRSSQPFVAVNCAALPENLLESELFGYEKGAFTGAANGKMGRFELADGGTLFLDEIGDTSLSMQVKLLRVLQERVFERVGGTRPVEVNVRIITATNRDLTKAIEEKLFREDLYYRLKVFPIQIPPLRERPSDILALAEYFLNKVKGPLGKRVGGFSPEAEEILKTYQWPGNVRELSNIVERAVILCPPGGTIGPEHLGIDLLTPPEAELLPGGGLLRNLEREAIAKALEETAGNRKLAAVKLGISLRNLYYKLKEYHLE